MVFSGVMVAVFYHRIKNTVKKNVTSRRSIVFPRSLWRRGRSIREPTNQLNQPTDRPTNQPIKFMQPTDQPARSIVRSIRQPPFEPSHSTNQSLNQLTNQSIRATANRTLPSIRPDQNQRPKQPCYRTLSSKPIKTNQPTSQPSERPRRSIRSFSLPTTLGSVCDERPTDRTASWNERSRRRWST